MDAIIFDMDGVLIDVSGSYRKAIQRTVEIYLETCLGFDNKHEKLVTDREISLFKSAGGFNNDWDLTSGLLLRILSCSNLPPSSKEERFSSIREALLHLKTKSSRLPSKMAGRFERAFSPAFIEKVRSSGGGLKGVRKAISGSWHGWVYQSGELSRENIVKRIFQEGYLGKEFFPRYHLRPLFYVGEGLWLQEKLLIPAGILATLRKKVRMGIASGRPRFEAELALKRFHLLPYFDSVVTLDECNKEESRILRSTGRRVNFSKPHPYSILRAAREMGASNLRCAYVGDVVDDMAAAQAAKKEIQILAAGFLSEGGNQEIRGSLAEAGADLVIEKPEGLLGLLSL